MISHFVILLSVSYGSCANLMLNKGSLCTWDGATGKCVSDFECPSAVMNIARKRNPPVCTNEDKIPIICCTDSHFINDKELKTVNPTLSVLNKTQGHTKTPREKTNDKCLEYTQKFHYKCQKRHRRSPYIQGGRDALRNEFPHMALLGFGETVSVASWRCGGSVISERFILTVAHCVYSVSVGDVKYIALGILKRSDPQELWQIYNVKRAIRYPEYHPPSKYHDIALLETDRQIVFSPEVLPVCLDADGRIEDFVLGIGWGARGFNQELADVLQVTDLRREEHRCFTEYSKHRHRKFGYDNSTQVCYGDTGKGFMPTDTCEGDSGGPLQLAQCLPIILAVTSYGHQCGERDGIGIYTRITYYVSWIQDIVWP